MLGERVRNWLWTKYGYQLPRWHHIYVVPIGIIGATVIMGYKDAVAIHKEENAEFYDGLKEYEEHIFPVKE